MAVQALRRTQNICLVKAGVCPENSTIAHTFKLQLECHAHIQYVCSPFLLCHPGTFPQIQILTNQIEVKSILIFVSVTLYSGFILDRIMGAL